MTRSLGVNLTGRDVSLSAMLAGAGGKVRKFNDDIDSGNKRGARSTNALTQSFRGLNTAIGGMPGNLSRVAAGIAQISDHGPRVKLLAAGFVALGAGAAIGLGMAISKAAAFDSQMRNVNSLMHLSEAQFGALEKQVLQMSTRLPQSAETLAEGLYNVTSSGYQGAEALKILNAAATAASAGMTDTETAGRAITSVLQSYGLGAAKAADVSDTLFQTVNLGVLSFSELAGGLGDVVGIAATAHVSIDQVGSAIATMTLSGQNGATATNSLQNLLQKTIKPSQALSKEFKELGYQSGAQALQTDGLRVVMEKLRVATGGNIEKLLQLYPDIQAARGALALMANEGKNYTKVAGQIENADARRGATQKTLNEQMKSFNNQMQLMKNRADAVVISLGTKLLPVAVDLLGGLNKLGGKVGELGSQFADRLGPAWADVVSVGHSLVDIFGNLTEDVGPLVGALAMLAALGVVATLTAIAQALSVVAGLVADHTGVVEVLAIAYGVRLLAGLVAAQGGLKGILQYRLIVPMLYGMSGAADKAGASMAFLADTSKLLGGVLAIGAGVAIMDLTKMYNDNKNAGKQTQQQIDEVVKSLGQKPDISGLSDALDKLQQLRAENEKKVVRTGDLTRPTEGNNLADYKKSADELAAAQAKVQTTLDKTRSNLASLQVATGLSANKILELAKAAGIDLSGSFTNAYVALQRYQQGTTNTSTQQQQLIKAMTDLADAGGNAEAKVKALKAALDALMGGQLGVNEATRQWESALDDLSATLAKAKGSLDNTTESGRANTAAIDSSAKALSDLVVAQATNGASSASLNATWDHGVAALRRTMSQAGFTKAQIDRYTSSLGLVPGNVQTIVNAAGASASANEVARLRAEIASLQNKTVTVTATTIRKTIITQEGNPHLGVAMQAHGGIYAESYAGGGISKLPKSAMISDRNGPALVQWREPGTGGEAFIPLDPRRRDRSEQVLARVADMFGLVVAHRMANGGILSAASGAVTGGSSYTFSGSSASAVDTQGALSTQFGPSNSLAFYSKYLHDSLNEAGRWRSELGRIATRAGADVAAQLAAMGEQGVMLVHRMATGTQTQMNSMAKALRSLRDNGALTDFKMSLQASTVAAEQFQRDLQTIIKRGQTGLAAQLSGMGAEAAGAIAHQAAGASTATLASVAGSLKHNQQATDPNLAAALQLAGLIGQSPGQLGITGLAQKSGMSVGDVYVLLTRYRSTVFGNLGAAARLVSQDLNAVTAGRPVSGHKEGAIIPGGKTGYYWGEPGSDGESLIPHRRTARARALWDQTGQILGMQKASQGGTMVTVAPGAVSIKLDFKASDLSAQQVEGIATRVTTRAVRDLTDRIRRR